MTGLIVKAAGAVYDVLGDDGGVYRCRARGRFRIDGVFPLAGDRVSLAEAERGDRMIDEILPRRNRFVRPPTANVDRLVIVASAAPPVTERRTIDLLAAVAAYYEVEPVICVNKTDVEPALELIGTYRGAGYRVIGASAATGFGSDELRAIATEGLTVFTGASGVGKSSLLNLLDPEIAARTSDISERIGRGRHTTRVVELYPFGGGYVVDTPGFSDIDAVSMEFYDKQYLARCFPDFAPYIGSCRYDDCAHYHESSAECAVKKAVEDGKIAASRHESYAAIYESLAALTDWEIERLKKQTRK